MRFWDSSAIAPLLVDEGSSELAHELLTSDQEMIVWWGSRIECASAIRRRERERSLVPAAARVSLTHLRALADSWAEVQPTDVVRVGAERALAVHPLRAGDALQLSAALIWAKPAPDKAEFVCWDERLRDAAAREGLVLLPDELG